MKLPSVATFAHPLRLPWSPDETIRWSARTWFVVTALGQWIFVAYIVAFYLPLLSSAGARGLADTHLPGGYVPGDTAGNGALIAHLLLSVIVVGGGPLQLMPRLRTRYRAFHRWNGRLWMTTTIVTSLAGLYLTWTRKPEVGGALGQIGTSLDGLLILIFAPLALHSAVRGRFGAHRRWALRLFMVVSSVWFFRIGYKFWTFVLGGFMLSGFFKFWYFGQYLVPLAALELFLWAQVSGRPDAKYVSAGLTALLTAFMSIGIYAATTEMWLPRVEQAVPRGTEASNPAKPVALAGTSERSFRARAPKSVVRCTRRDKRVPHHDRSIHQDENPQDRSKFCAAVGVSQATQAAAPVLSLDTHINSF